MALTGYGGTAAAVAAAAQLGIGDDTDSSNPGRVGKLSLSPRQQTLDKRWAHYRCEQYAPRRVAWDGSRVVGSSERDSIALAGYVPPGFYIANSETLPIQFRRPTTPYHLCKVIVDRFTSLLFGQKRHPRITVAGDKQTEDFVNAVVEVGRLWPAMMQARTYGGATGTAVVGFKLVSGRPMFEVFDSRWCIPKFIDRSNLLLGSIEYRHTFKHEVQDRESGEWVEVDFWYRRVIDTKTDTIFEPVRVDPTNPNPSWKIAATVQHGLGFCPVVWIQNQPGDTEIDGDPDCMGVYELAEAVDRLLSQSERGVLANCDPTVVVTTDAQMGEIRKGSQNALKLPAGGSAQYMEMSGGGIMQAREQAQLYKDMALEVAQCVLEQPDGQKTATEVERNFAAMLARADTFREQYGEMGVKRLINMVLVAAVQLTKPRLADGKITRFEIRLPKTSDGQTQKLGKGPFQADLAWPPYFEPSLNDANMAVQAASGARMAELIDDAAATKFIAPFFQLEDVSKSVASIKSATGQAQAEIERMALEGPERDELNAPGVDMGGETPDKKQDVALNGAQVTALADLVKSVALGELPAIAAIEIIIVGFPVPREVATKMVNAAAANATKPDDTTDDTPEDEDVGSPPAPTEGQ